MDRFCETCIETFNPARFQFPLGTSETMGRTLIQPRDTAAQPAAAVALAPNDGVDLGSGGRLVTPAVNWPGQRLNTHVSGREAAFIEVQRDLQRGWYPPRHPTNNSVNGATAISAPPP